METKYKVRTKVLETLIENSIEYEVITSNDIAGSVIHIDSPILNDSDNKLSIIISDPYWEEYEAFYRWDEILIDGFRMGGYKYYKYYNFIEDLKLMINHNYRILYQDKMDEDNNLINAMFIYNPKIKTLEEIEKYFYDNTSECEDVKIIEIASYNKSIYKQFNKPIIHGKTEKKYKEYLEYLENKYK